MSEIKRYRFSRCKLHFEPHVCLCGQVEQPHGDYIFFADHARIMAEKDAEIRQLTEALARYKDVQDGYGIYSAGAVLDPTELQCGFCNVDILPGVPKCPLCGGLTMRRDEALNPPWLKGGA